MYFIVQLFNDMALACAFDPHAFLNTQPSTTASLSDIEMCCEVLITRYYFYCS